MKISRLFNSLPKRLFTGFLLFLAVMLPVATSAASTVKIEGSMGVANVTAGDTQYAHSVNATYSQVVKFQVYYHNTELPDSGKTADNLHVKINIPTTAGNTQTQTATISADNSNTVTDSTTVKLDRSDAYLQYIPGSAVWRHNVGTNDNIQEVNTTISDNVVNSGTGLVLENEKPCYNFSATITVEARIIIPGVSVNKYVRHAGDTNWSTSINAKAGDTVQYEIAYKNTGNTTQEDVEFRDQLPKGITYVPGTTMLKNSIYPTSTKVNSDALVTNGIIADSYAPGAAGYVMFDAKVGDENALTCGDNQLRNIAFVQPKGMNYYYNTADVNVSKTCTTPTPVYSCNLLTLSQTDNRTVNASVQYTAKDGATYKSTSFNWGDSSNATSGSATNASHSYSADGTYKVVATITFDVNGTTKTASSESCAKSVTFKTTPPPKQPVYSCDLLSFTQGDNRTVTASVAYTAKDGATFKTVTLDWGDGSTPLTTDKTTASYQYAKDGTYTMTAKILFSVNGTDTFASSENCVKQVSFTTTQTCVSGTNPECTPPETPPSELPNTGAGNVIGIFAGVVIASTVGYRVFLSRKLAR